MTRTIATGIILACFAFPAFAAPKLPTLTQEEVSEGWLMLFDGESLFGWKAIDTQWTIAEGMMAPQKGNKGLLVSTTEFGDCEVDVELLSKDVSSAEIHFGCTSDGKPQKSGKSFDLKGYKEWASHTFLFRAGDVRYSVSDISSGRKGSAGGSGIDPKQRKPIRGHIAISGEGVVIRKIKVRPIHYKPIFNGKDLSGWKIAPERKSTFTVNKEGELEVKNGSGDLLTEKQWDNFFLQLDCRTNGEHLNSGIFFRCKPNEYQQGYEAQIHNKFDDEPKKEYAIEEYDPVSNKLTETRKAKYHAVDYGTGAVYRRQPARKQVAKDKEWFTMTVAANGRHIAIWVNGVMVTDWTDNRPANDNPRQGCRVEKGHISIQGHDPTTDLSFRNIRIDDFSEK